MNIRGLVSMVGDINKNKNYNIIRILDDFAYHNIAIPLFSKFFSIPFEVRNEHTSIDFSIINDFNLDRVGFKLAVGLYTFTFTMGVVRKNPTISYDWNTDYACCEIKYDARTIYKEEKKKGDSDFTKFIETPMLKFISSIKVFDR